MQPVKHLSLTLIVVLWGNVGLAQELPDNDGDGMPDVIEQKVGTPQDVPQDLLPIATSPDRGFASKQLPRPATRRRQEQRVRPMSRPTQRFAPERK